MISKTQVNAWVFRFFAKNKFISVNYLSVENISKSYGERVLFEDISFGISKDQKVAFVAKNGSGKTSILNIIAGLDVPDSGQVVSRKGISIAYLAQKDDINPDLTIEETIFATDNKILSIVNQYESALKNLDDGDAYQAAFDLMDQHNAWDFETQYRQILSKLKLDDLTLKVGSLSGGQRKRLSLAIVLINKPDLLILDEPTNHLDLEMIEWLEAFFAKEKITLFMVTHDRYFLERVCNEILELDEGKIYKYKGNYSYYLQNKEERLALEATNLGKSKSLFKKELEWTRMNAKGRQSKSKARLANYDKLLSESSNDKEARLELFIPNGPRLGNEVLDVTEISKAFDDKLLYDNLTFKLPPAGIVGIIGPNGAGKTTLFRMIMGEETPDKGTFKVGDTVKIGYVDQSHEDLLDDKTIFEVFSGGTEMMEFGGKTINSRAYLSRFNFQGGDQNKKVGTLSGGERNRLHLAMAIKQEANVLLLDEPTNHLDIISISWLENYLKTFEGAVVTISHDRMFLDNVTKRTLEITKGKLLDFAFAYSKYKIVRAEDLERLSGAKKQQEKDIKHTEELINKFRAKKNKAAFAQSLIKKLENIVFDDKKILLKVNGIERQSGNISEMVHKVDELISFISNNITLHPGDLIFTGTPSGVNQLNSGDYVEAEIEDIGRLDININ